MFDSRDSLTLADLKRRVSNLIRIGTVCEVDCEKAVARVKIGDITTAWLPWILRAGDDQVWHSVDIGEQVLVLASCGDLGQAVILPSLHKHTPICRENILSMLFKDGSSISFDRNSGNLTADITGNASLTCKKLTADVASNASVTCQSLSATCASVATIKAPNITLDGNVSVTGNLATAGSLSATGAASLGGGGPAVARVGDKISVKVGSGTYTGTIITGSSKATSG